MNITVFVKLASARADQSTRIYELGASPSEKVVFTFSLGQAMSERALAIIPAHACATYEKGAKSSASMSTNALVH